MVDSNQKLSKDNRFNIDLIYPVGSIYMSVNDVNPSNLFGGTWERIKDTFLLAAGDSYSAGSTGGEAEHKLLLKEMPKHTHYTAKGTLSTSSSAIQWEQYATYQTEDSITPGKRWYAETGSEGQSFPHNNMPPYIAVYVWKRIQ